MREMHEFEKTMLIMSLKNMVTKLEKELGTIENLNVTLDEYDLPVNVSTALKMMQFSIMQISAANAQMVQSTKAAIDALEKM